MFENNQFLIALGLTVFAGLSTGIGSAIAFFAKKTNPKFLSVSLGFSAGVMIYVSFAELLQQARETLVSGYGTLPGNWYAVLSFFGGIFIIAVIDKFVPSVENPHEMHRIEEMSGNATHQSKKLMRMGLLTAMAITIHNFPEGMATFIAAYSDPTLGIAIAVAIAIHNIPEGIAVSVPIFYATGSRRKAFFHSFVSGLAEPVGAIAGYFLLFPFLKDNMQLMGVVFAAVAGIMVFISLDELLPSAEEFGEHHLSIYGLIAGMGVMATSLLLFIK